MYTHEDAQNYVDNLPLGDPSEDDVIKAVKIFCESTLHVINSEEDGDHPDPDFDAEAYKNEVIMSFENKFQVAVHQGLTHVVQEGLETVAKAQFVKQLVGSLEGEGDDDELNPADLLGALFGGGISDN